MLWKITIVLCLLVAGCFTHAPTQVSIDLIKRLPYAEKIDESQVIVFGRSQDKNFLLAGWSQPEKDGNETFQWASAQKTSFFFKNRRTEPLYLHIKLGSFFSNSASVFVNRQNAGRIKINGEADVYSLRLPKQALHPDTNVIEFDWDELRRPENQEDPRSLAAAAYFAVITPAQYLSGPPHIDSKNSDPEQQFLNINGKKRAAIQLPVGGTIRYYEKLNKNSRLKFGIYYHPPAISEDEDYADFTVLLRKDGTTEKQVFEKRAGDETASFENLSLGKYIFSTEPAVYEIEFRLNRNSVFDSGKAAWIEPQLLQDAEKKSSVDDEAVERIRTNHEGANVIIMLLDAAGAKHFQAYGYNRDTAPNFDALAREGVLFDRAYCQAVYTLASTGSLMSGLDPYRHQVILRKSKLPSTTITLAERFQSSGYNTGTFVANGNASNTFGMTQGFNEVAEVFRDPNYTGWGSDISNRFFQWLDKSKEDRPFFAYLHYREPHAPFNPPEKFKNRFTDPNYTGYRDASYEMRRKINMGEVQATKADRDYIIATYDENLRYGDYEVGRVINKLKQNNMYENTVIIVTADHGEAFWEHGFQGHNSQMYEESIHIPLVIKFAGKSVKAKRVPQPVRTIDIYPTLVDLLQFSRRQMNVDGHSFIPYLFSSDSPETPVMTQTIASQAYGYIENGYKYMVHIQTRKEELYDLKSDPMEKFNRIDVDRVQAAYLRSRVFGWLAAGKQARSRYKTEQAVIDPTTRENLEALGYIDKDSPKKQEDQKK
jgi:arylsulfatase A-like enzyme